MDAYGTAKDRADALDTYAAKVEDYATPPLLVGLRVSSAIAWALIAIADALYAKA